MNKTMNKKTAKKTAKKNVRSTTYVSTNIDQMLPSGSYRARKYVDGVRVSKCFKKLKDAKAFLKG